MKKIKTIALAICFVILASLFLVEEAYCRYGVTLFDSDPSAPFLLSPSSDKVDLTGKSSLSFQWERSQLYLTDYFDFRVYKGYVTSQDNLIFKKQLDAYDYPVSVPASYFEVGQTYTWILVQVFSSGVKSERAFDSFSISKK